MSVKMCEDSQLRPFVESLLAQVRDGVRASKQQSRPEPPSDLNMHHLTSRQVFNKLAFDQGGDDFSYNLPAPFRHPPLTPETQKVLETARTLPQSTPQSTRPPTPQREDVGSVSDKKKAPAVRRQPVQSATDGKPKENRASMLRRRAQSQGPMGKAVVTPLRTGRPTPKVQMNRAAEKRLQAKKSS